MEFSKAFGWEQNGFQNAILGEEADMILYLQNVIINIKTSL